QPRVIVSSTAWARSRTRGCPRGSFPSCDFAHPTVPRSDERAGGRMLTILLTILFDGIAYGMLLFVLACGLSVTLGLMNFVNLAHGAFAMAGGYVTVVVVNRWGVPFGLGLPIAFLAGAALGAVLERTLYVHLYAKSHLDQVLFTIGLVFMSV